MSDAACYHRLLADNSRNGGVERLDIEPNGTANGYLCYCLLGNREAHQQRGDIVHRSQHFRRTNIAASGSVLQLHYPIKRCTHAAIFEVLGGRNSRLLSLSQIRLHLHPTDFRHTTLFVHFLHAVSSILSLTEGSQCGIVHRPSLRIIDSSKALTTLHALPILHIHTRKRAAQRESEINSLHCFQRTGIMAYSGISHLGDGHHLHRNRRYLALFLHLLATCKHANNPCEKKNFFHCSSNHDP